MPIDFSNIRAKKKDALAIDPVEIFQNLKVSDQSVNDLWLAQGDALREWHKNREKNDVGIVLNTGAGKSLVGLLIAQSLLNESKKKVLYTCSSIQLVEQTADKARGYGISATTYFKGRFNNDLYDLCKAPCITTYQALFNGRSMFFNEDVSAVIFDDAHTAEHLLRDQFSITITKDMFPELYTGMVGLFREYHRKVGKAGSYDELESKGFSRLFLIPPFELHHQLSEVMRLMNLANLSSITETKFPWEYLKDKIDLCSLFISPRSITITPPFLPIRALPYFTQNIRRVYLSATLKASDAFTRTFGCDPDCIIAPETTAGECERLILFPSRIDGMQVDIETTKSAIREKKVLILVPTYSRAEKWSDIALPPDKNNVTQSVNEFKDSHQPDKLLLAARYDGMDLPGETCRVMVIDDLPMGVGPLERFLWGKLQLSNYLRTTIASRIVQSFGRISRGMSDHGVVLLTGESLVRWLITPKNSSTLPDFLQKQIQLGYEISKQAENIEDLVKIVDKCLRRDMEWLCAYENFLREAQIEVHEEDTQNSNEIAESEASFGVHLWNRDYQNAAKCLRSTLTKAFSLSSNTGAWHTFWLGSAYWFLGDQDTAIEMYIKAHAVQRNIPAWPSKLDMGEKENLPQQIVEVDRQFKINADSSIQVPNKLDTELIYLDGSGSSNQTEESLRALGQYLGMDSSRPDNEFGTGPDVLWLCDGFPALCIEVKTDKDDNSQYKKVEIGQLSDHVQWVKNKYSIDLDSIVPIFVGPTNSATEKANPAPNYRVINLQDFHALGARLTAALHDVQNTALPLTLRSEIFELFKTRNLLWPNCLDTLDANVLSDM